ncbi:MAG TPA: hypothetical protein VFV53_06165, partial [Candidatus Limnocylindrales bacterium]|nr:hypothetical protein [Candidatus Limnocylindrales bacterium]
LGFEIGMTWLGVAALAIGAIVLGIGGQLLGTVGTRFEWVPDASAAFLGGFIASESLGSLSTWGWAWEGVYVVPALIGAIVLTVLVDAVVRWGTGGSFRGHAHPA